MASYSGANELLHVVLVRNVQTNFSNKEIAMGLTQKSKVCLLVTSLFLHLRRV